MSNTEQSSSRSSEQRVPHTPGPWDISRGHDARGYPYFCINGLSGEQKRDEVTLSANAKLMEAAPDLLEALEGLHGDLMDYITRNHLGGENNHWMVRAREAIKKARA